MRHDVRYPATVLLAACSLLLQPPAIAQAQDKAPVFKPSQVTESALIEALAIEPPDAPADGVRRGVGIVPPQRMRRSDGAGGAGPGKASLLMTFTVDSAELTPDTTRLLDTVAKALQSDQLVGFYFRIEGHADPRGGDVLNQRLSAQRAQAVIAYLVQRHGILAERLSAVGKGSSELIDKRNPISPLNRRVTIVTHRG